MMLLTLREQTPTQKAHEEVKRGVEIRILTQKDTKIVSVEQIKEIKSEDNSYLLQGKEKDGNIVNLGKYREPHYSNHVMLYNLYSK